MVHQAAATVETLLGVNTDAGNTRLCLVSAILSGSPVCSLDRLASVVAPGDARFKFRLIPKATLERRKKCATRHLTSGDRLARLAKVYVFALDIYRDSSNGRHRRERPDPGLARCRAVAAGRSGAVGLGRVQGLDQQADAEPGAARHGLPQAVGTAAQSCARCRRHPDVKKTSPPRWRRSAGPSRVAHP